MKKTVQVTALLFTSALLLSACGQDKKEETTVATTQDPTTQETTAAPTTATPTTATPTTVYSLENAQKAVFEAASNSGTDTMTLYYKDDVLLKEEKVSTFIISKLAGDNPLEMLEKSAGKTKEKLKVLIGKGTYKFGDISSYTQAIVLVVFLAGLSRSWGGFLLRLLLLRKATDREQQANKKYEYWLFFHCLIF